MAKKKADRPEQGAIVPNLQPTCTYRIVALDPTVKGADGRALTAQVEIPNEQLSPGPRGYRVQVIDYDATNRVLYKSAPYRESELDKAPADPERDRDFHARNVYAIVMRVLSRFESALGRRVRWSFRGHQLSIAPHAFVDLNAFYSKDDNGIFFGYYPGAKGTVFTCLSHEVIAHETTHALVDGLRDGFLWPSSADQAAFHEGFADVVALFSVLSLREVVSAGLDLQTSLRRDVVKRSALTERALKEGVLLGLAKQVGEEMYGTHGVALRRSVTLPVSATLAEADEFKEPHRRGELVVAAVLGAFVRIWKKRIDEYGILPHDPAKRVGRDMVSRAGVVDAAVETAEHLLTMAIRALDYCPPADLLFGDFLSAMLTADYEVHRDDSRFGFRDALRKAFASFGFKPASESKNVAEEGLWEGPGDDKYQYSRTHFASMQHDKDEVFRFIWENRLLLKVDEDAYTKVEDVLPCFRVSSDGFLLRETVAVYTQQIRVQGGDLHAFGVKKPGDMPDDQAITLYGGGTLILDEAGRLKYHIRNRIRNAKRQDPRLQYLWDEGVFTARKSFGALHLQRTLRIGRTPDADSHSPEDAHVD